MGKKPKEESILGPADNRVSHLITESDNGVLGQMNDEVSGEVFQPVLFSPVFRDDTDQLCTQDIYYSQSVIKKNAAAKKYMGQVATATMLTHGSRNPVATMQFIADNWSNPDVIDLSVEAAQDVAAAGGAIDATYIGGMFAIKRYPDNLVALRINYSKELMHSKAADYLAQTEVTERIRPDRHAPQELSDEEFRLRDASALIVMIVRKHAEVLKPAIVNASRIGIKGF